MACSLFALCSVFSWYPVRRSAGGYGPDWNQALAWELLRWNLWAPLAGLILRWERRLPSWRPARARIAILYGGALLVAPAIHSALLVAIYFPFVAGHVAAFLRYRSFVLVTDYLTGIVVCGLVLGLAHARGYYLRLREEELRTSHLETQLAQAQLEALKMQLHPHFLFNTLHAISALQTEDPDGAQSMMARLADFLRLTLENSGVHEVRLEREVDFLSRYLEIERVRFPRLAVSLDIDPGTLDASVPNLILQPIVENAIRHGIAATAAPGRIEIGSARRGESLLLRVRDTGPGLGGNGHSAEGIGLRNTRARLDRMYGDASRLSLDNVAGGGLEVTIEMPFVNRQ
ncbi:MAG TPA: histidine kinase [Bryobacteraceae bacterium]|nr:histidine kinase [Bryobacteraceae bacterium]